MTTAVTLAVANAAAAEARAAQGVYDAAYEAVFPS